MFLIGLTGGIAAGKSTVAEHWRRLGAIEVDADVLAREVVAAGSPGLAAIVAEFGPEVLTVDGELNRAALADRVFGDENKRRTLEAITHPLIRERAKAELAAIEATAPADQIVVYSIPLLVETNSDLPFDAVVTVEAPQEKQVERMVNHRGMTAEAALRRIASQSTPVLRAARADVILSSNQDLALLLRDAEAAYRDFERMATAKAEQQGAGE